MKNAKRFCAAILLGLMAAGAPAEEPAELTGAALELAQVRAAFEKENFSEAFRHLAIIQTQFYREADWLPEALFYEALIDRRMGEDGKACSALDELNALYPASSWCLRAKKELINTEKDVAE